MSPKTKKILIYALVAILALSGITAAAQAFAPDNLKPFKVAKSESSSSVTSSSSTSSSSVSSVSSTSSIVSSAANSSTTTTVKTKTYTNQYFPDFKLVYPEDWKFETGTSESYIKGLLNRTIKLNKNGTEIKIVTGIIGSGGDVACMKSDDQVSINDKIKRYNYADFVSYSPKDNTNDCFKIMSDINASEFPLFKEFRTSNGTQPYKNATKVEYVSIISTNNKNYLPEIDQIISQSSFK
jgi:hypothetical protein